MKLLTYYYEDREVIGVLHEKGREIIPLHTLGLFYRSMNELIEGATTAEMAKMKKAVHAKLPSGAILCEKTKAVSPIPIPKQDIICLGWNYSEHVAESSKFRGDKGDLPEHPIYFSKRVNRAIADGEAIPDLSHLETQLDYEVELGVIIGKDAKNVSAAKAKDYIFGYTIINDVSARTLQRRHKQFYFGKSLDGTTPMGPWIVTADEFSNFPPKVKIASFVNGEVRQSATTAQMIFSIPHIIAELSAGFTLKVGTIIATGTPGGVGMGFDPPRFLKSGDVVECEIEGIGKLTNRLT